MRVRYDEAVQVGWLYAGNCGVVRLVVIDDVVNVEGGVFGCSEMTVVAQEPLAHLVKGQRLSLLRCHVAIFPQHGRNSQG